MKIVYSGGTAEIVEKKSRFIATVRPVSSEEEAAAFLAEMKKKYWDARHNCSAFLVGEAPEISRCSDDGEPAQTAGRPMLDVLLGEKLHNVAVVVTRYFGGVLLGTGGLVRAYQRAVREGLAACTIMEKRDGFRLSVVTEYTGLGRLQHLIAAQNFAQRGIALVHTLYTERVELLLVIPAEEAAAVERELSEATNGTAILTRGERVSYGVIGDEVQIF